MQKVQFAIESVVYCVVDNVHCRSLKVLLLMMIHFLGVDNNSSEVQLGRMLQILREFSADPILSVYVIDDVWEYMNAMKVSYLQNYKNSTL